MGGWLPCGVHADRPAAFECRGCNVFACADCASHEWVKDHFEDRCPRCRRPMQAIAAPGGAGGHERGAAALAAELPEVLSFLKQPALLLMLAGLTLLTAPLSWALQYSFHPMVSLLGVFLILSLELSIYFRIVVQTAYDTGDISPPELTDIGADLVAPTVRFLAAMLPIIGGVLWFGEQAFGSLLAGAVLFQIDPTPILDYPGPALLVGAGVLLLPLLTVVAALSGSVFAVLNPMSAVSNLRTLGATYWLGSAVFYGVLVLEKLVIVRALWWLYTEIDIPVLGRVLVIFIGYLPFVVRARILGLMVRPYVSNG